MSLKILHTADWHLGQTFFEYDRLGEHRAFFRFLKDKIIEKDIDVLLICGDVFDVANPSAESQKLFYRFLRDTVTTKSDLTIIVISGNHDSPGRLEAPTPLLEEFDIHVIGFLPRTESNETDHEKILIPIFGKGKEKAWCLVIPFIRSADYSGTGVSSYAEGISLIYEDAFLYAEKKGKKDEAIMVTGHLHVLNALLSEDDRCERSITGGLEAVPETASNERIAYTALGHIHKAQRIFGRNNVRYAGSPLPMSFSEIKYKHHLIFVEIEKDTVLNIEDIEIPRLIPLMKIPNKPELLDIVLSELSKLPEKENADETLAPYPEVNVLMDEPLPSLRNQIEAVLNSKNIRLAKITTAYLNSTGSSDNMKVNTDDLKKMAPIDILKNLYKIRYDAELPEDLDEIFSDAYREALNEENRE